MAELVDALDLGSSELARESSSLSVRILGSIDWLSFSPIDAIAREEEKKPKLDYDPFDLRIKVTRFTNPLAVKILIFSIVYHPFAIDGQDWLMLKTWNLDELLAQLFEKYPTLTELEDILYDTAKSLQDSERYLEPAWAIMQSIRPFYEGRRKGSG